MGYGLNSSGSEWRPVAGSCKYCNEPSGSIVNCGYLEWVKIVGLSRSTRLHGVSWLVYCFG
jgi:hypothetical protein